MVRIERWLKLSSGFGRVLLAEVAILAVLIVPVVPMLGLQKIGGFRLPGLIGTLIFFLCSAFAYGRVLRQADGAPAGLARGLLISVCTYVMAWVFIGVLLVYAVISGPWSR